MSENDYDNSEENEEEEEGHTSPQDCLDEMTIKWSDKPEFGDKIVEFIGKCSECGREFTDVFIGQGIIHEESGEYVHRY